MAEGLYPTRICSSVGVDLPLSVEAHIPDLMSLKDQLSLAKELESNYDSFMRLH